MSGQKPFLIAFGVTYFMVAIGLNLMLGPPGLSQEYLDEYKADHDRYMTIVKSDDYKLWLERPERTTDDPKLNAKIIFASEYEARDEFKAEQRRRGRYDTLFNFFNVGMLVLLIVRLAKKPLLGLLDSTIADIEAGIDEADTLRDRAAVRKHAAESRLANIEHNRERLREEYAEKTERENTLIKEHTAQSLELLARETEDRKRQETAKAARALKMALIDAALDHVRTGYEATRSSESESKLTDQFVDQIGQRP